MKVRVTGSIGGIGFSYVGGEVVDVPDELGKSWIGSGAAEPVDGEPKRAERKAPRKATKKN